MSPSQRQAMLLAAEDYERTAALVERDRYAAALSSNHHLSDGETSGHAAAPEGPDSSAH